MSRKLKADFLRFERGVGPGGLLVRPDRAERFATRSRRFARGSGGQEGTEGRQRPPNPLGLRGFSPRLQGC